jgi:hypothetical protein
VHKDEYEIYLKMYQDSGTLWHEMNSLNN